MTQAGENSNGGVIVTQLGARRHYAVPIALEHYGHLRKFCTDIYIRSERTRAALHWLASVSGQDVLRKLGDRFVARGLPSRKVVSYPLFGVQYKLNGHRARRAEERTANWIWGGKRFAELCVSELDASSTAVYSFTSAAYETFEVARTRGIACWLDHATAPRAFEVGLIQDEARRFPGWSVRSVADGLTPTYHRRQRKELQLADRIVCGSSFAKRAILAEGVGTERVFVVPLGIAEHLFQCGPVASGDRGPDLRVLYVGGDGLRKGIGYLNAALDLLDDSRIRVKAAGDLELSEEARRLLSRRMDLLGPVARSSMPKLFGWADVLVLPSVSDTFGMVILEAMAAGLVVVASENTAGPDILRDGIDGFVVPIRSPGAIAAKIAMLAQDRRLLLTMQHEARLRSAEFSVAQYGRRLVTALGLAS